MNLTVEALAPLEDILVVEITAYERGKCEAMNHHGAVCLTDAAAIVHSSCPPVDSWLACANYAAWVNAANVQRRGHCLECGRRIPDCWSVVMLP